MFRTDAQEEFYCQFATVDIDAVWRAREVEQDARNKENKFKNEPYVRNGEKYALPQMPRRGIRLQPKGGERDGHATVYDVHGDG